MPIIKEKKKKKEKKRKKRKKEPTGIASYRNKFKRSEWKKMQEVDFKVPKPVNLRISRPVLT